MKEEEVDRFKKALRRKIEEKPIHSVNDAVLWRKVLQEVKPDVKTIYKNEYPWYAVAAAALLFICFGLGLYFYKNKAEDNSISEISIIGKANSPERYDLTEEEINNVYGNIEPLEEKSHTPQFSSEIHNEDKIVRHKLMDGSLVTINTGSTIKIGESFSDQRNLMLEGEAYFEVKRDKSKPFTVYFSDFKLVVVGTKFNIRNIPDEKIKEVTVTEGIVRVFENNASEGIEVKRGEQLKFSKESKPVLLKVETANYISWNTGNLDFKTTRLEEVVTLLSRKFEADIILTNQIKNCKFTGDLSGLTLEQSLEIISSSTSLKVENSNNKLYVTGSGCD